MLCILQTNIIAKSFKVANTFNSEMFATMSQTLSWSHFIELATIEDATKCLYYQQMSAHDHWSLRKLRRREDAMDYERSLVAAKPEDHIVAALTVPNPTATRLLCSKVHTLWTFSVCEDSTPKETLKWR